MVSDAVFLAVLVSACAIEAQFQLPLISQFIPSSLPFTSPGRALLQPPPPPPSAPSSQQSQSSITLSPQPLALETFQGLKAPPPNGDFNASPKLEDGPLRIFELKGLSGDRETSSLRGPRLLKVDNRGREHVSEESTSSPFAAATPTTIKFTLDDVADFLSPSVIPTPSAAESTLSFGDTPPSFLQGNPLDGDDNDDALNNDSLSIDDNNDDSKRHLFILTSTETEPSSSTWQPSTPFSNDEALLGRSLQIPTLSTALKSDVSFRPSFVLPFLEDSSSTSEEEKQHLFTAVETRQPRVSSFLRSQAPHLLQTEPEVFTLNPVRVGLKEKTTEKAGTQILNNPTLSKAPVPKPVQVFKKEESLIETVTKANKPLPTRKTFHFEQEFLSLLKKTNNPINENNNNNKPNEDKPKPSPLEPNPFWFSQDPLRGFSGGPRFGEHSSSSSANEGVWKVKGGDRRTPSLDLVSQDSVVSQIALKNTLGGLFATSIRGLSPITPKNEASLKILDDEFHDSSEGITVKSLAQGGLSSDFAAEGTTTVKPLFFHRNFSELRLKPGKNIFDRGVPTTTASPITSSGSLFHGPQVVLVGEVGEVTHDDNHGASTSISSPAPALSATLKHGVQSLNVTAWVTGCPKLYGKAELNCVVEHDAISNTPMTLTWKKKSFTEGRPQEHTMTENDLLKTEDDRFSVSQRQGHYVLTIKDFRPKDCGTYECEAKAADTTAASQLLLFTCL